jgi:ATP-binding cassette subfamily B protein/subfamily B ATP-binding cassette protein MsbA
MKNFWTAIKDSLHHSPAILLATLCSVGIAFLWGSNIGALYPVIDMTLHGESMQSWLEKKVDVQRAVISDLDLRIIALQADGDAAQAKSVMQEAKNAAWYLGWQEWALRLENRYLPKDPFQTICCIMGLLIASTLVKHLLMLSSDLLIGHVSTSIVRGLRQRVFDSALHMDRRTYQHFGTSGMMAAITSAADGLATGLMALFGAAVREPLRIVACLIGACIINWRLLLLSVVLAPLLIMVVVYFNRKIRAVASTIIGRNAGFHEVLLEALNNIFTVQAFTMERAEKARFAESTKGMQRISLKMILYTGLSKPFTELIGVAMVAITVCAGAYLVVNRQTHIGFLQICDEPMKIQDLLIFFGLLIGASDPLRKLSGVSVAINSGAMAADFLYSILNLKPVLQESPNPVALPAAHHVLSLQNVSFHYNGSQPVLQSVNLEVPFGKTVAVLGPNGSGKSTLIQLLCRYYDPVEGCIAFDGVDLRSMAIEDIRKRIALVSQSTELFNRTVAENILYGNLSSSHAEMIEASKKAHAHSFITSSLEHGYDTVVGQSGQRLSGGQRQRIALARAILRKPEILILDESTSQIDMASELKIRETLQAMKGQMTIIIITHREALLAVADEVYEMDCGTLVKKDHSASKAA